MEYDADYAYTAKNDPANFTFDYLVKRKNCKTNQTFTSTNIMDYSVSYSDRFTNDQRSRIRHVLTYSPLIPGPNKDKHKRVPLSKDLLIYPYAQPGNNI